MKAFSAAMLLVAAGARAATLAVDLPAGREVGVEFDVAVDDDHLRNPAGYFPADEPAARVVKSLTIENVSAKPIGDPAVFLNGRSIFPSPFWKDIADARTLFDTWIARRAHGTNDLDASRQPEAVSGFFGATFCGDDSRALGEIFAARGCEMRFARLNGHSVGEFRIDGEWCLLDGDQNLVYLDWDNRRLCSEAEILADPLLALRTKVFGRQAEWNPTASWQNTSRFEFVDAEREQKRFKPKPAPPRHWTLRPGETVRFDLDRIPETVLAASPELRRNRTLRQAAREATFSGFSNDGETRAFPLPILRDGGEPEFEAVPRGRDVVCQIALAQIPLPRSGKNVLRLAGANGAVRVSFEFADSGPAAAAPPKVAANDGGFSIEAPGADRLWWDIREIGSGHAAPNLDRVQDFVSSLALNPVDETFLSAGREYSFRAKVRVNGVWSDWSEPAVVRAEKPARPVVTAIEPGADGSATVQWQPAKGEMLVFGSDRIDFLPEVYGDREVTRMENGAVRESRPNKNLLATVPAGSGEAVVSLHACYRLIARDGAALSVPSELVRLPRGENIPAARVLQTRHEKSEGELVGRDVAVEMPLP